MARHALRKSAPRSCFPLKHIQLKHNHPGRWVSGNAECGFPPTKEDSEFRFVNSGEYTSYLLEEMERKPSPPFSADNLVKLRDNREANHTKWGAFFEVARLGLHLPCYVDFIVRPGCD